MKNEQKTTQSQLNVWAFESYRNGPLSLTGARRVVLVDDGEVEEISRLAAADALHDQLFANLNNAEHTQTPARVKLSADGCEFGK